MMLLFLVFFLAESFLVQPIQAMQSNNTCAQLPKDKRQLVCVCGKQLQLRCTFNLDIKEIDPADMDKTLRPIYMNEVTIHRTVNPNDPYDVNLDLQDQQKLDENNVYLYFPNFSVLSSPYLRITFIRFMYVPSFAFIDYNSLVSPTAPYRSIASVVFELAEINDFGIDQFAFYGLESESLVIEGPFNQLTIHADAFRSSRIDELTIGCYCLECESFLGDCRVLFGQKSIRTQHTIIEPASISTEPSSFKRLKLFGIQLDSDWSLDDLPNVNQLEHLEISNLVALNDQNQNNILSSFKLSVNKEQAMPCLKELHLRNNGIKQVKRRLLSLFTNLTELNLAQNEIEKIEADSFAATHQLAKLNLERNKLKRISKLLLNTLDKLRILNLKENQIDSVEDLSFSALKYLEYLDLTRNKLHTLNEKTFSGMTSLKELMLSYNPLKVIHPHAFRSLAIDSTNLARLDLVSSTEADWFVFDEQDICLLSYFRCETEINIDTDQRCNCFVKYLNQVKLNSANYLSRLRRNHPIKAGKRDALNKNSQNIRGGGGGGSEEEEQEEEQDEDWFQPCSNEIQSEDENMRTQEYGEINVASRLVSQEQAIPKLSCSRNLLRKCFDNSSGQQSAELLNRSCLYQRFFEDRSASIENKQPTNSLINQLTSSIGLLSNKNLANEEHFKTTHVDLLDKSSSLSTGDGELTINRKNSKYSSLTGSNNQNKHDLEQNLFYLLVGLLVVFGMSICSLLMSVYLMIKRNTFIYQTAGSSYPVDER